MSNIIEELLAIDLGEVEMPKATKKIYLNYMFFSILVVYNQLLMCYTICTMAKGV